MQNDKLPIFPFSPTLSIPLEASLRFSTANLQKAARYLVPPHDEREPINASNVLYSALPFLSLILMAGLARRRGTWLIRLAWLPVALALTLRVSFGHFINDEYFYAFNHGKGEFAVVIVRPIQKPRQANCVNALTPGSSGIVMIALLLRFALTKRGVLKMGETYPGVLSQFGQHNGNGKQAAPVPAANSKFWTFVSDALELFYSHRGIGWKFGTGTGLHVAPDWRNTADRDIFLHQTLRALAWNYIILDCLNTALSNFAGLGATDGGQSIFGHGSSLFETLLVSTVLHCMTGFFLYRGSCQLERRFKFHSHCGIPLFPLRIRIYALASLVCWRSIRER
jgi:hypothetical protein